MKQTRAALSPNKTSPSEKKSAWRDGRDCSIFFQT